MLAFPTHSFEPEVHSGSNQWANYHNKRELLSALLSLLLKHVLQRYNITLRAVATVYSVKCSFEVSNVIIREPCSLGCGTRVCVWSFVVLKLAWTKNNYRFYQIYFTWCNVSTAQPSISSCSANLRFGARFVWSGFWRGVPERATEVAQQQNSWCVITITLNFTHSSYNNVLCISSELLLWALQTTAIHSSWNIWEAQWLVTKLQGLASKLKGYVWYQIRR